MTYISCFNDQFGCIARYTKCSISWNWQSSRPPLEWPNGLRVHVWEATSTISSSQLRSAPCSKNTTQIFLFIWNRLGIAVHCFTQPIRMEWKEGKYMVMKLQVKGHKLNPIELLQWAVQNKVRHWCGLRSFAEVAQTAVNEFVASLSFRQNMQMASKNWATWEPFGTRLPPGGRVRELLRKCHKGEQGTRFPVATKLMNNSTEP